MDLAIVVVGVKSGEGTDRPDLSFGDVQNNLVSVIADSNPNTIVIF